LLVITLAKN
jgi:hypothetical protein